MKAIAWERYFAQQRERHGKRVFTVSELANVAQASPASVNVMLSRLRKARVIERIARGVYAAPGTATVDDLLPALDSGAYVTGARVLFEGGIVTQSPATTLCFTNRRPFRRERDTGAGRLVFRVVRPPVYAPPASGERVGIEQALLDLAFTTEGRVDLQGLYTFRALDRLRRTKLERLSARYPDPIRDRVAALVAEAGLANA